MTFADMRKQIPSKGKTCGVDLDKISSENWLDWALEEMATEYLANDDLFKAGMATAVEIMSISLTTDGVDWKIIQNALKAMQYHMD